MESEYTLMPSPAKLTPEPIVKQYEEAHVRLDLLYEGKDPFDTEATLTAQDEDIPPADPNSDDIPF